MEQIKYDVFISYSRKDYVDEQKNVIPNNVVSKIREALTQAGITYWFDEEGIYSGDTFTEKIVANIEVSQIFVYLSTANANISPWTSKEIACADEMGKYIIPVRIDSTPYNRKVLFRIADRSYIDYYVNPQKGLDDLISSINNYLEKLQAEKKLEEKRIAEEQEQLIREIKLECSKINSEEVKIELDRKSLLLSAQKIIDKAQQEEMIEFISTNILSREEAQDAIAASKEKIANLQESLNSVTAEKDSLNETAKLLTQQLAAAKDKLETEVGQRSPGTEYVGFTFRWRHPLNSMRDAWLKIKETMAQRHWIVNVILWLFVVCTAFAFIIMSFGHIVTAPSYCALFGLTAYALVQLLLNKRAGIGLLFLTPFLLPFLAEQLSLGLPVGSVLISTIVLPFLFVRKDGKLAMSLLEGKKTHALHMNKFPVFYLLYVFFLLVTCMFF